jgi:hypothetical protein
MYKSEGDYNSSRREGGARGKSPLRRDQPSSNYFPSQRTNGPSSSSNGNAAAAAARATSLQREKTSSRMNVSNGGGNNELNERKSGGGQMGATNMIKSNMKQKRALARERWNILKQVMYLNLYFNAFRLKRHLCYFAEAISFIQVQFK